MFYESDANVFRGLRSRAWEKRSHESIDNPVKKYLRRHAISRQSHGKLVWARSSNLRPAF
jgi:hypothetical protein